MTAEETAFAAGLFEGEGYVRRTSINGLAVEIKMTDKDPLEKMFFLVAGSKLKGPFHYGNPKHSAVWRWKMYGKPAKLFLMDIYPWLGARRQKQISNAIEYKKQTPTAEGREGPSDQQVPPLANQCLP